MKLEDLLTSLTDAQRDYIAALDYGQDVAQHRSALDAVIAAAGVVDFAALGHWYPYEVIELGKNVLSPDHKNEYAACMGIVLKNMLLGGDQTNEIDWIMDLTPNIEQLPAELRNMLNPMIEELIEECEQSPGPYR
jgi:hypothetical protein